MNIEPLNSALNDGRLDLPPVGSYYLLWVRSGHGQLYFNHQHYPAKTQRIFLLPPVEGRSGTLTWQGSGWLIRIAPWLIRTFFQHHPEEKLLPIFRNGKQLYTDIESVNSFVMHTLILFIRQEQEGAHSVPLVQAYLYAFLLQMAGAYRLSHQLPRSKFHYDLAEKLLSLIGTHFKAERLPAFYAAQLGVPSRKLNRECKRATGKRLTELVTEELLAEAERLLAESALSIKEIAYELNFADMAAFNHFMKKHTGLSPSGFRRLVQADK